MLCGHALLQVARLQREERLGALGLELANRKRVTLAQLRGFARTVNLIAVPFHSCAN